VKIQNRLYRGAFVASLVLVSAAGASAGPPTD